MPRRRNTLFVAESSPPRQRNGSLATAFKPSFNDDPPQKEEESSEQEPDERTPILAAAKMHALTNGSLASTSLRDGNHLKLGKFPLADDDYRMDKKSPSSFHDDNETPIGGRARRHSRGLIHQRSEAYYFVDLDPTLDRFADDTSMLGFRYLHSRYKNWFRCMWALMLFFFLGLTIYQVCERISYYFISNPLKTTRTYDTPSTLEFPTIVVCNKMQIKASKVAEINPRLLSAISQSFDDEHQQTKNETLRKMLHDYEDLDIFSFYVNTRQNVEDLFVSCQFGKSRNCIDNVKPVLTPNGHCFSVELNTTVRRPGPESTLHLLLNLEIYENIPGWVSEPGIVLSMFDSSVPSTVHFAEGMHLEPGKAVTIPINDIRRLQRHESQCGSDPQRQKTFHENEYSRSACQWLAKLEDERQKCDCEPVLSPTHREYFTNATTPHTKEGSHGKETRAVKDEKPHCSISKEIFCITDLKDEPISDSAMTKMGGCAHDCNDISYTSVVFGNDLHTGDITHFLPGDWEDEKEKRLEKFQLALENLPKNRIPLVKHIQRIANEAQQFLRDSIELFGVDLTTNTTNIPCFGHLSNKQQSFDERSHTFHREEGVWTGLNEFLEQTFRKNIPSVLELLSLDIDPNFRIREVVDSDEKDERWYLTQSTQALYKLRAFRDRLVRGGNKAGFNQMHAFERVIITRHLFNFLTQLQKCVVNVQMGKQNVTATLQQCRQLFMNYYNVLYDARTVAKTFSTDIVDDFATGIYGLSSVLQKLNYESPGSIFTIKDYLVDLRRFCNLYKDGGQGYELLLDLLKFRKFIQTELSQKIYRLVKKMQTAQEARQSVLDQLELNDLNRTANSTDFVDTAVKCMQSMLPKIETIRKSPLIRAELMSRIHHEVTVAQSYSPGPEYDRVNLLFLKLYFAHFKEEIIVQERSYNLFLLLAEIGGTIGLYVGAALLSVAETIVFFFEKRTQKFCFLKH
ncbi:hypothetical protein M3Y97_00928900 [Aphelenchoides bicaudatus]|nr:hypothetical protein M3Y97_00928900 [Aphelenchoides bicaudatus]